MACTDYYEEDFRYINQLYGLSSITTYNIIGVLLKILYKYRSAGKRNFLVSSEEFAHVFDAEENEDIDAKLKASIIAIKKDFKHMSNFVPLIFKPRGMYTSGLFFISDKRLEKIKEIGWDKYLTIKYNRTELEKMLPDETTRYLGDVYSFSFKKCWEDNYNDNNRGISFANFKRKFYENELENVEKEWFDDRIVLKLNTINQTGFGDKVEMFIKYMEALKETLDDLKMSNKWYTLPEIAEKLTDKCWYFGNKKRLESIIDPMFNLLSTYNNTIYSKYYKFADFNSSNERYHIVSSNYDRAINNIKDSISKFLKGYENSKEKVAIINTEKHSNNYMRQDTLLVAVQLMELLDLARYTFDAGDKPEFFVRVNDEELIDRVIKNKSYQSRTLNAISKLHYDSVRYMKFFFEQLKSDEERWNFIESYFLGNVEDDYNIPNDISKKASKRLNNIPIEEDEEDNEIISAKVYSVYNTYDEITERYYLSNDNIKELDNKKIKRLSIESKLAEELSKRNVEDAFDINGYEYIIEEIYVHEVKEK